MRNNLHNAHDDSITVLQKPELQNGGSFCLECWMTTDRFSSDLSKFSVLERTFSVVSGRLGLTSEGGIEVLRPGESRHVPANYRHLFWNAGEEPVHFYIHGVFGDRSAE
jgi:glyoxylate utilization-related uncharacterized protein